MLRATLPSLGILFCLAAAHGLAIAGKAPQRAGRSGVVASASGPDSRTNAADGAAEQRPLVVRRGYLAPMGRVMQHPMMDIPDVETGVMQHPVMDSPSLGGGTHQDYLDLYDAKGRWMTQIVLLFANGAARPDTRERPIEVRGRLERVDLGGPEGTKSSYANDVVHVVSWRYLPKRDVLAQRSVRN